MADELKRARDHMKVTATQLYEAIVERDMDKAEEYAETMIQLITHVKRIESRGA